MDKQSFASNVTLVFGVRLLIAVNSFIAGVLVARLLGAESFGAFAVLYAVINTMIQVGSLGMPTANTYFTAQNKSLAASAAVNSAFFAAISGVVSGVCAWLAAVFFPSLFAGIAPAWVAIAAAALPFQLATLLVVSFFVSVDKIKQSNITDLISQSLILLNVIVALVILKGDILTLITLNASTSAVFGLLACYRLKTYLANDPNTFGGQWQLDLPFLRKALRYALKGHIQWVSTLLLLRLDLIIVANWRGTVEAGVYSVATQVTLLLLMIPNVVSWLLLPKVTGSQGTAADMTCKTSRHASLIMVIACLAAFPASCVLPMLYGPAFASIPVIVLILLPGVYFVSLQMIIVQYFVGTGLPLIISVLWAATVLVNVGLNLLLVPKYGAYGAAAVSTFCYILIFFVVFTLFRRRTGRTIREVLVWKRRELRDLLVLLPIFR